MLSLDFYGEKLKFERIILRLSGETNSALVTALYKCASLIENAPALIMPDNDSKNTYEDKLNFANNAVDKYEIKYLLKHLRQFQISKLNPTPPPTPSTHFPPRRRGALWRGLP